MSAWLPVLVISMLLVIALSITLGWFLYTRRPLPANWGMLPFILGAIAVWMLIRLLATLTPALPLKLHWHTLQTGILITLPGLWLLFVLGFSGEPAPRLRRWRNLLLFEPALMLILLATNSRHGLYWQAWQPLTLEGFTLLRTVDGPAAIGQAVYTTALLTASAALLLRVINESTRPCRRQALGLLVAGLLPWGVHYGAGLSAAPEVVAAAGLPLALLASELIFIRGLSDQPLLRVVPLARKTVIDKLQDGVIVLDQHEHIVDINAAAAAILASTPEDLIGQVASAAFANSPGLHPADRANTLSRHQIEVALPTGPRYYDLQLTPLQDDREQFSGQLVTLHDITEHKQAETALEAARAAAEIANRTKSEFLANISHELRTPLNVIVGYTDLTLRGTYGELTPLQQERLAQVFENSTQLAALLNDLIDVSRAEAHDFPLSLEVFDPSTLLREAVHQARSAALKKNLAIHVSLPDTLPPIAADARRLSQVLSHLFNNAIKFTSEGYLVLHAVTLKREDTLDFPLELPPSVARWLMVAIQDTGIGIEPSQHAAIFEDFRQVDGSHTRRYQGAGVGLTLAHRLTRLMNGHIWIESSLNQGSTVYVMLPAVDAAPKRPALHGGVGIPPAPV